MARKPRPASTRTNLRRPSWTLGTTLGHRKMSRRLRVTPAPLFKENHPRLHGHGETLWAHRGGQGKSKPFSIRPINVLFGACAFAQVRQRLTDPAPSQLPTTRYSGRHFGTSRTPGRGDRFSHPFKLR